MEREISEIIPTGPRREAAARDRQELPQAPEDRLEGTARAGRQEPVRLVEGMGRGVRQDRMAVSA